MFDVGIISCYTVFIIIFSLVWYVLHESEKNDVDTLPGPPALPFFGTSLSLIGLNSVDMFKRMRNFTQLYGDRYVIKVIRRRIVQISNPDDIEVVLTSNKNISKSYVYSFLQPWLGTGLLLSTDRKWRERRKILTPAFHFNILRKYASVIEERCRKLVYTLEEQEGADVDVLAVVGQFTLHTICETAMGIQLDAAADNDSGQRYKQGILDIGQLTLRRLTNFWLHNDIVFSLTNTGRKLAEALKVTHEFTAKVIDERKKIRSSSEPVTSPGQTEDVGSKKKLAMLELLLEAEERGEIDLQGVHEEVDTFMFEGHDTTSMGLTFAIMLLADHKHVQDKIYEECERIFSGDDRSPSVSDLAAMKYLEAVVKETLRLYPSVPFIARKITEDLKLGDVLVKRGTEVAIHIYDLHRRPDLFSNPDEFHPERFLGTPALHPFGYVPFSAGPRNCIGQKLAMQQMKCALSDICRRFLLVPTRPGWRPTLVADLVLRPVDSIHVRFVKR